MAYFSNGSEGEALDSECLTCRLGVRACPIYMAQVSYNYEACNNPLARCILNMLVKQEENYEYVGCQLKPLIEDLFKWKSAIFVKLIQ